VKRQLIAWILLIVLGLEASLALAAISTSLQSDCHTSESHADTSHKACCPSGAHTGARTMSCCLDVGGVGLAIPMAPVSVAWYGRSAPLPMGSTASFLTRGDSPLIRPPIL